MRVPLSWLAEFVDLDISPEALAERLTLLGMEVKGIERRGDDWRSVVVGELLEVARHPSADRLSLTRVRVDGDVLSIVCGATNIAPGQRVPVALPGAILPGDRRIDVSRIAGETSQGMLCSGDELRLTADADGILILPADAPLGRPLAELYGDVVLDVDVKPNRGDALSVLGLAREVSAATGAPVREPRIEVPESGDETRDHLAVEIADPDLCSRFVGRWVDGLRVGESPLAVQLRLTAAGMRPVSNVVDASNYVMLELGKPIHTFDADAVHGGRIVVRRARPGERIETLDHVERALDEEVLLIADPEGPLGIAGVMGGAGSEVGEETRAVVVESAIFDPVSIRRTAQRYALRSEASLRFEKGQAHGLARLGADRTAQLLAEWAGGRVARGVLDTHPEEPAPVRVAFRPARVARLLGADIESAEMTSLLGRVGVLTEPTGEAPGTLVAVVPPHRRDIAIEADVAEEVARVRGYETLAGRLPATPMPAYRPDPRRRVDELRELLAAQGLSEVVNHALLAPDDHARLGIAADDAATIGVANPVSAAHTQLRRSLLPGLLHALAVNERQRRLDVTFFEVGSTHEWREGRPMERPALAILAAGDWLPGGWAQPPRPADALDLRGLVAWLARRLGLGEPVFAPLDARTGIEHPGRTAAVLLGGGRLGRVGELHPRLLEAFDVRAQRVAHAELDLAALLAAVPARRRVSALDRQPAVERDLAVIVRRETRAGEVEAVIRHAAGELLRELRLFDRYEGAPLAEGEVSLAYRLRLRAAERTLTDDEVDALVAGVVAALAERLEARIRD
ncbi:MAG TPA: phenylalanine--tRNA ligase subunit beta [Candidatus Limnocylindrales bacterium]|nr:phenylalanine--tRNA ligase subunit beta [Candidatus Limnocylindrales bacterium]